MNKFLVDVQEKKELFLRLRDRGLTSEMLKPFRDDFDKFLIVHKILKANTEKYYSNCPIEEYLNALTKIYYDNQFNSIYNFWKKQDKRSTFYDWAKPSLDHIILKSRGGTHKIDNLQILTVFENLAKRDMTQEEWVQFKKDTHTSSDYFIENICDKGGKDYESK